MPTYMFRRLWNCLSTLGFPILPSEPKMRLYRLPLLKHADKGQIDAGVFLLRRTAKDSSVSSVPYLKVKDLAKYVNDVFTNLELQNKVSYTGFNDEIWILFSGDKGGSLMKFHFEIINGTSTGSIFNVHVFCLYEGADIPENMWQHFDSYRHVISEMQSDCYRINGKKFKLFLGGDLKFLHHCLGHQRSSASYPSHKDLVSINHLQDHGDSPHAPDHCHFELRDANHYAQCYNENLCEDRQGRDLHKTGKFHFSVISRMMFHITTLDNVVPPILHINLGIVLKLYEMLLHFIQNLDAEESGLLEDLAERRARDGELAQLSEQLLEVEGQVKVMAEKYVELINIQERVEQALANNIEELDVIAKRSDNRQRRKGRREVCESLVCSVSGFDDNILWVKCDQCQRWMHSLCECFTNSESDMIESLNLYTCLKCQGKVSTDLLAYIQTRMDNNYYDQNLLESTYLQLSANCERFKLKDLDNHGIRGGSSGIPWKSVCWQSLQTCVETS